jgi:hypothetical protein
MTRLAERDVQVVNEEQPHGPLRGRGDRRRRRNRRAADEQRDGQSTGEPPEHGRLDAADLPTAAQRDQDPRIRIPDRRCRMSEG